jgi:hypothetical protein
MTRSLQVIPEGLFSMNYTVLEAGANIAAIANHAGFLQIKGTLTAGGNELFARREGAFRANYLLETAGGSVRARATKRMALREEYEILFAEGNLHLRKRVLSMRESFVISDSSGDIGTIARESLASRRLLCTLEDDADEVPLEILLFLVWMTLIIRRREASATI